MRGGFYIRLAATGISKNKKLYYPYILTCICMVMMFYIVCYLAVGADFQKVYGGGTGRVVICFGVSVLGLFSLFFFYYQNPFFLLV